MTSARTSFIVTLGITGFVGWALFAQEPADKLCVNGHPAKRHAGISYGGLIPRAGFERDHWVPLCLGGRDTPDNVRYQPLPEARRKNGEERELCEAVCRGDLALEEAVQQIKEDWP